MTNPAQKTTLRLGINYYAVLGLDRSNCTDEDIRRGFEEQATRLNPLRAHQDHSKSHNDEASLEALRTFAVVAEAYEVLRDPLRREIYDRYGESGLKSGVRTADGDRVPGYRFHGEPLRTYREFFRIDNPYRELLELRDTRSKLLGSNPFAQEVKRKDDPVVKPLPLSLSEIWFGAIKKIRLQRLVLVGDEEDRTELQGTILTVRVAPGLPTGSRIVFPEAGHQGLSIIPADVVFVTEDRPHPVFRRAGADLRMTMPILLSEALTGTTVPIDTIDGRMIRVPITSIVTPEYKKVVENEGLPILEDPDRRGDLIIDFAIEFPAYMPVESKYHVRKAFATGKCRIDGNEEDFHDEIKRKLMSDKLRAKCSIERAPPGTKKIVEICTSDKVVTKGSY